VPPAVTPTPSTFFPVGNAGPAQQQVAAAKAVCHRCPVIDDCLTWAVNARHEEGVWGGQDMSERRDLRHRTRGVGTRRGA
jgi:WhiB family transcriptional regulator, redox-sensing transcriptional regulator